jgi:hypothetical protein
MEAEAPAAVCNRIKSQWLVDTANLPHLPAYFAYSEDFVLKPKIMIKRSSFKFKIIKSNNNAAVGRMNEYGDM